VPGLVLSLAFDIYGPPRSSEYTFDPTHSHAPLLVIAAVVPPVGIQIIALLTEYDVLSIQVFHQGAPRVWFWWLTPCAMLALHSPAGHLPCLLKRPPPGPSGHASATPSRAAYQPSPGSTGPPPEQLSKPPRNVSHTA
jgi:hypothetical protein